MVKKYLLFSEVRDIFIQPGNCSICLPLISFPVLHFLQYIYLNNYNIEQKERLKLYKFLFLDKMLRTEWGISI